MVVDAQRKPNKLTLREFLAREDAPQIKLGAHFNGGAFMDCHCRAFAETGIWIEELVPVFQKLDAHLAVANEKTVRALQRLPTNRVEVWEQEEYRRILRVDDCDLIVRVVRAAIDAGEVAALDVDTFAIMWGSLLDGLVVQVALDDPVVTADRARRIALDVAFKELGLDAAPARARRTARSKA